MGVQTLLQQSKVGSTTIGYKCCETFFEGAVELHYSLNLIMQAYLSFALELCLNCQSGCHQNG